MAAAPAADPGRRLDRPPRRVLARRRAQQRLAGRHRRELGARALLPRRAGAARLPARRRAPHGQGAEVDRLDAYPPVAGGLDRPGEKQGLVAEHGDAEDAHPVPGGHGRPSGRSADAAVFRPPPGRGRGASAARVGVVSMGGRARERALAVQPDRRPEAARAGAPAAIAGHRLEAPLRAVRVPGQDERRHARAEDRRQQSGQGHARARREQRDGPEDERAVVARLRRPLRSGRDLSRAGDARPASRAAQRHVQRRRALRGYRPVPGHRAVRGGGGALLPAARPHGRRRPGARGSPRADRVQRDAGDLLGRHVGPSIRPAAQPGALQPAASILGQQRSGSEPLRAGAELRLLHGQHASGLAKARPEPLDGHARSRRGRRDLRAERGPHDGGRRHAARDH